MTFEFLVSAAFIVPTVLSVSIGWFFIRRGRANVGILAGLSLTAAIPIVCLALVKLLPYDENMVYLSVVVVLEALGSAFIFLLVGAVLIRHYKGHFTWLSFLLLVQSIIVILCSIIGMSNSVEYAGVVPIETYAALLYVSLFGVAIGIGLFVLAIRAAKKHEAV